MTKQPRQIGLRFPDISDEQVPFFFKGFPKYRETSSRFFFAFLSVMIILLSWIKHLNLDIVNLYNKFPRSFVLLVSLEKVRILYG